MLKNEYLYTYFFGFHPCDSIYWARFILPFVLTFLYILFFARFILNPAYKQEIKYKTDRKIEKAKSDTRYQKERNKLDKTLIEKEQNKAALQEAQRRQIEADPKAQWDNDYYELSSKQDIDHIIKDFKSLIYEHGRVILDEYGRLVIDVQSLTSCEAYGLFTRNSKNHNYIDVTDKGWYFIRKHG